MSDENDEGWEFLNDLPVHRRKVPKLPRTVGYKKPPKNRQFKKGQSGNPKGRPPKDRKERKLMHDLTREKLSAVVTVKENGTTKKMTLMEVVIGRLIQNAVNGDKKALDYIRALDKEKLAVQEKEKGSRGGVLVVPGFLPDEVCIAELAVQQKPYREKWPREITEKFHKALYKWCEDFYMEHRDQILANPF